MKHPISIMLSTAFLATSLHSTNVMAHQAGDLIVRAGLTTVNPDTSSSSIVVDTVGNIGMKIDADSSPTLGLNVAYMVNNNWAIELLAATPFSHDISLQNSTDNTLGLGDGALAETKQLPPTLSALYYFDNSNESFSPYVGLGVNYTIFFEDGFVDSRTAQTFTDLELDNSFGIGVQAGFDYHLDNEWMINASVRYIDIETEARFRVLGLDSSVSADIDPLVYSVMLGYSF